MEPIGREDRVQLRWRSWPEGNGRVVKIDWAVDRNAGWRPVYLGPDTGEASLPAARFPGADCGRLRVRINDGFDEAEQVIDCLQAKGRAPAVWITSPEPGSRFAQDATVFASGESYDDRGTALHEDALHWFLNASAAGTGNAISFARLPDGRSELVLDVADRLGRTSRRQWIIVCERGRCEARDEECGPPGISDDLVRPRPDACAWSPKRSKIEPTSAAPSDQPRSPAD